MDSGLLELDQNSGHIAVLLYKVAMQEKFRLPRPSVHVYLSGVIERSDAPSMDFVARDRSDLEKVVRDFRLLPSQAQPYFVSRNTGEFYLVMSARAPQEASIAFPAECFRLAHQFARRLGRDEEADVLSSLSTYTDAYATLLGRYFRFVDSQDDVFLDDADFSGLKEYLSARSGKFIRELALPKMKPRKVVVSSTKLIVN